MNKLHNIALNILNEQQTDPHIVAFKDGLHQGMLKNFRDNGYLAPVLFFMNHYKYQPHFELIPQNLLATPQGKAMLGAIIKRICTSLNIVAAGIIIEAYAKSINKNDEISKELLKGNKKVSDLEDKQDIIMMIFSTPLSEEVIAYYVDPQTQTIKDKIEGTSGLGGTFSGFFQWRKASMNEGTSKTIKHKWDKVENSRKLKHAKCGKCKCEKWWDSGFGKLIYQDRYGKTHYRAPECVLPNTKL